MGWKDGSVGKLLVVQLCGSECNTQNPYKSPVHPSVSVIPVLRRQERGIMGAHWPASLADSMRSGLT